MSAGTAKVVQAVTARAEVSGDGSQPECPAYLLHPNEVGMPNLLADVGWIACAVDMHACPVGWLAW